MLDLIMKVSVCPDDRSRPSDLYTAVSPTGRVGLLLNGLNQRPRNARTRFAYFQSTSNLYKQLLNHYLLLHSPDIMSARWHTVRLRYSSSGWVCWTGRACNGPVGVFPTRSDKGSGKSGDVSSLWREIWLMMVSNITATITTTVIRKKKNQHVKHKRAYVYAKRDMQMV